ncbi:Probable chromosome-partitioning protein parB [Moraxella atlantae]|uniref:Probable chromosome-partitioning protein parB n=2 Tax=Faucicola atlantae TaxID=34059 RepID=A0A378QLI5_9GAMM|nr:ParB/RepB/Spo0J family partition protein [Moraxella atlantae]STZ01739.1 Probable chromosome-partitioning protein parB [Moraxella atlantae]
MTSQLQTLLKEKIHANIQAHSLADKEFTDFDNYQSNKLEQIPLDKIQPNSAQPRFNFNDETIDELAQSINDIGLLQPITVRKKGDIFEIIAGERRFRAFQKLGKPYIDCIVANVTDEQNVLLALAENLSREDLSDYEIAKSINSFKANFPSKTEYAKALGISRQKLYKLLSFENLPQSLLIRLDSHPTALSADVAEQITTLRKQSYASEEKFDQAVNQGFDLILQGQLKQSKLVDFILRETQRCPNSDTVKQDSLIKRTYQKDGKSIGKIKQTSTKYVVELDKATLTQASTQKIEEFFDSLLNH